MLNKFFLFTRYFFLIFPILWTTIIFSQAKSTMFTQYVQPQKDNLKNNKVEMYHSLTPQKLDLLIEIDGGLKTIHAISKHQQWNFILKNIATGRVDWINITPSLLKYAPSPIKLQLKKTLIKALYINPKAVLKILSLHKNSPNSIQNICGAARYDLEKKKKLIEQLQSIHSLAIVYQKRNCLEILTASPNDKIH
ncbi:hypothetical protein COMNV_00833 [Commensalibacter sp. Nvir]|uniref:hypothetical protein n=1 Tax=Commensalibacter sp. Nvir TaxID=3069817 RepID=UPI002D69FAA4|nr:hypothetical protein COMNV_00833 [Commensalibacter sp. Nvir]